MTKLLLPLPPQLVEGTGHRPLAGMRNAAERPILLKSSSCSHLIRGKYPCCWPSSQGTQVTCSCQLQGDMHSAKLSLGYLKNIYFFLRCN